MRILSHFTYWYNCLRFANWKTSRPMRPPNLPWVRPRVRVQARPGAFPVFLLSLAQWSTPWRWRGVACSCWCYAVELELRCAAAAALLSIDGPRLSPHPARALILSRTGSRTASSAVLFTYPRAEFMCRKCFLMQDELALLVQSMLVHGTCLSAQWSWHERTCPPFLGTLNVYVLLIMHFGGNR